ncbi:MAG: ATP-dependent Clp protease ATP-binding subunit, partial [Elusimicrobia bacterium]|nr:ATP-dependent Clp protease ATP-binding subunit [Elusimicrobiota bacterium]
LQVMDDGVLSDNLGHKVSFKNTVFIMTSNVGARLISKGKSLGFVPQVESEERDYKTMKDTVMEEVRRVFNPEFINRVDEIIVFHPLMEAEMKQILGLMLKRVETRISTQGYKLEVSEEARKFLVETGFDPNYGARPLQRTIQRTLEDPLAEDILQKKFEGKGVIYVQLDETDKKLLFSSSPVEKVAKN